jgi:hypothetical protein
MLLAEQIPPSLVWAAWIITLLFAIASGVINLIQLRKSKDIEVAKGEVSQAQNETAHWKGTAGAWEKELVVVRERCDRLEAANADLTKENATLHSRTDLESLKAQTANIEKLILAQSQRSQERHDASLRRHEATLENMREVTSTIKEMHEHFLQRDSENSKVVAAQFELIKSLQSSLNLKQAMQSN